MLNAGKWRNSNNHLKVAFGGEGLLADRAPERLVAGVRAHVDLQRGRRREVLAAHAAQVLRRRRRRRVARDAGHWNNAEHIMIKLQTAI